MIRANPVPTPREIDDLYANHYGFDWFAKRARLKRIQALHRWQRVKKWIPTSRGSPPTVIDIGCGHGHFLMAAHKAGARVAGVELSDALRQEVGDRTGFPIYPSIEAALADGLGTADLVTMWHVLEHMLNPEAVIAAAGQLLRPGGVAILAVPNADCVGMRVWGPRWVWCQEPYVHVWHFTPKALDLLFRRVGYRDLRLWTRDTWDAQFLFDGIGGPLLNGFYSLCRKIRRAGYGPAVARSTGRNSALQNVQNARFYLEESLRLACYGARYLLLPVAVTYEAAGCGSELLAAVRMPDSGGGNAGVPTAESRDFGW